MARLEEQVVDHRAGLARAHDALLQERRELRRGGRRTTTTTTTTPTTRPQGVSGSSRRDDHPVRRFRREATRRESSE